jgi:hypothetical protein
MHSDDDSGAQIFDEVVPSIVGLSDDDIKRYTLLTPLRIHLRGLLGEFKRGAHLTTAMALGQAGRNGYTTSPL